MSDSDSWQTPDDLFDVLDKGGEWHGVKFDGYHFDIDLAATRHNSKCEVWANDYLKDDFHAIHGYDWSMFNHPHKDNTCWLNPPYSRGSMMKFIGKAWEDSKHCKIVCLVKVDTSTEWWSIFWQFSGNCPLCTNEKIAYYVCPTCKDEHKYHGPKPGCEVIFLPKRVKFDPPKGLDLSCRRCLSVGVNLGASFANGEYVDCKYCKGTGKRKISGPSFASALIVMDRRDT